VCITAGSVVSNRQARAATLSKLKDIVGLNAPASEKQARAHTLSKTETA